MNAIRIAISGAAGRMGQRLVALGAKDDSLEVVAAIDSASNPRLGQDAGLTAGVDELGIPISSTLDRETDVVVDFSVPAGAESATTTCVERGIALVMATTGLSQQLQETILRAADTIAIVQAPSMSMAVNLTMKLAATTARALKQCGGDADMEIIERHHRFKEDAPSGTALRFGEILAQQSGHTRQVHGRHGRPGQRPRDEIGYHAVRVGDNPGEHTIVFGMPGETIELTVRASSRDCYALGALAAAKFVAKKPAGLYDMFDVLSLPLCE